MILRCLASRCYALSRLCLLRSDLLVLFISVTALCVRSAGLPACFVVSSESNLSTGIRSTDPIILTSEFHCVALVACTWISPSSMSVAWVDLRTCATIVKALLITLRRYVASFMPSLTTSCSVWAKHGLCWLSGSKSNKSAPSPLS